MVIRSCRQAIRILVRAERRVKVHVKTDVKTRLEPEGSSSGLSDPDQLGMARVCSCSCDSDRDRDRDRDGVQTEG